jgi:hypothetical protein
MQIIIFVILAVLVALLGRNRKIGYGWSLFFCLIFSPAIGLIIILLSKRNTLEFVEVGKKGDEQ